MDRESDPAFSVCLSLWHSDCLIMEIPITGTMSSSLRRRAYSTNQIEDYNPLKKAYTSSDPSSVVGKNPLRRAKVQELIGQTSPDNGVQWKMNYQVSMTSKHTDVIWINLLKLLRWFT